MSSTCTVRGLLSHSDAVMPQVFVTWKMYAARPSARPPPLHTRALRWVWMLVWTAYSKNFDFLFGLPWCRDEGRITNPSSAIEDDGARRERRELRKRLPTVETWAPHSHLSLLLTWSLEYKDMKKHVFGPTHAHVYTIAHRPIPLPGWIIGWWTCKRVPSAVWTVKVWNITRINTNFSALFYSK